MRIIPSPSIRQFYVDRNGLPLAGGKVFTYRAGTTEPYETYTDSSGLYVNTNPILLDYAGGANIFLKTNDEQTGERADAYKFVIYDKDGVLIDVIDPVYSLKGEKGIAGGIKGDTGQKGDTGPKGVEGRRGFKGDKGDRGDKGDNGTETHFWRTAGTYTFIVPEGVSSIDYVLCGGGGGLQNTNTFPLTINSGIATGTAGKVVRGTVSVNQGDTITVIVGAGGTVISPNTTLGNGQPSSIQSPSIAKITANGGTNGKLNPGSSDVVFQKASPFLTFQTLEGFNINIMPQPVFGESSPFGEGGNILKNGIPDATGNGASGGSGLIYMDGNSIKVDGFGKGGDGLVSFTYFRETA